MHLKINTRLSNSTLCYLNTHIDDFSSYLPTFFDFDVLFVVRKISKRNCYKSRLLFKIN